MALSMSSWAQAETPPADAPSAGAPAETGVVTNSHASRGLGVGLGGGSVSGLSAKYFLNNTFAVQGFAGFYFGLASILGADAMYQFKSLWSNSDFNLNWEAGAGASSYIWNGGLYGGATVSLNGVVGLSLQYRPVPLELTTDVRPTFILGDFSGSGFAPFQIYYGGALRYYF